jgi:hypothetical protein
MFAAWVASRMDAAFKAVDAVDGASFVKYLLGDFIVGTEMKGKGAGRLYGWGWGRCCRCGVRYNR